MCYLVIETDQRHILQNTSLLCDNRKQYACPTAQPLCSLRNDMNCPKCNARINGYQILRHSRSRPIICNACNQSFNFHKESWRSAKLPSALSAVFVLINVLFGQYLFSKYVHLGMLVLSLALLLASSAWVFSKVRNIKLVSTE